MDESNDADMVEWDQREDMDPSSEEEIDEEEEEMKLKRQLAGVDDGDTDEESEADEADENELDDEAFEVDDRAERRTVTMKDVKGEAVEKIIPPQQRRSAPFISKYERVRMIALLAIMIEGGYKPRVKYTPKEMEDPRQLAKKEFDAGFAPFVIKRKMPNGTVEFVKVSEIM